MIIWKSTIDFRTTCLKLLSRERHAEKGIVAYCDDRIWCVWEEGTTRTENVPESHLLKLLAFNPETRRMSKYQLRRTNTEGFLLDSVSANGDILSIITKHDERLSLMQFNCVTKRVFDPRESWLSGPILGDPIVFEDAASYLSPEITLQERDLSGEGIYDYHLELDDESGQKNLMWHNGEVYYLKYNPRRTVAWVNYDRVLEEKCVDDWVPTGENIAYGPTFVSDGLMVMQAKKPDESGVQRMDHLIVDTYDYEAHRWSRGIVPDFYKHLKIYILGVIRVKDKVYIFVNSVFSADISLRILDLKPTLKDMCLAVLTKKVLEDPENADSIMEGMPLTLKRELQAMVNSRKIPITMQIPERAEEEANFII